MQSGVRIRVGGCLLALAGALAEAIGTVLIGHYHAHRRAIERKLRDDR